MKLHTFAVRPSDMIQVSEVHKSLVLNLCFLCNSGSPSKSISIRKKTRHASNTASLQHNCSIRMNRATV